MCVHAHASMCDNARGDPHSSCPRETRTPSSRTWSCSLMTMPKRLSSSSGACSSSRPRPSCVALIWRDGCRCVSSRYPLHRIHRIHPCDLVRSSHTHIDTCIHTYTHTHTLSLSNARTFTPIHTPTHTHARAHTRPHRAKALVLMVKKRVFWLWLTFHASMSAHHVCIFLFSSACARVRV